MSRKQLVFLAVLLLVLGGIAGWMHYGSSNAWKQADTQAGAKVLPDLTISNIAALRIEGVSPTTKAAREANKDAKDAKDAPKETVTLERKGDLWTVKERGGYAADIAKVAPLLVKLAELKVTQTEAISEAVRPRLLLAAPGSPEGGVLVELLDANGKPLGSLIAGKAITKKSDIPGATREVPSGRYLLKRDAPATAIAVNDPLSELDASPVAWLDKTFIKPERVKNIALTAGGSPRWIVSRNEEAEMAWALKDATKDEDFDSAKAQEEARALAGISMVDVATNAKPEDLAGGEVIIAETFDGLTYTLAIGKKEGENRLVGVSFAGKSDAPRERAAVADEKAEDKTKADKEFKDKLAARDARLAQELAMDKKMFLVTDASIAPLIKERAALMKTKQSAAQPDVPGLSQFEKKAPAKAPAKKDEKKAEKK